MRGGILRLRGAHSERSEAQSRNAPLRSGCYTSSTETQPALFERDETVLADHQMVEHVNVQQLARLDECAGDGDVFRAGRRVAGRMVVHDDDACGVDLDGLAEDFGHADERG